MEILEKNSPFSGVHEIRSPVLDKVWISIIICLFKMYLWLLETKLIITNNTWTTEALSLLENSAWAHTPVFRFSVC